MTTGLPNGLSPTYWSVWYPGRNASVSESLEPGESWIGGWSNIGLYEGNNKVPEYQSISFHLTTHRLILIPDPPTPAATASSSASSSKSPSLQAHLSNVRQTEYYTGFMRSSPKITLTMGRPTDSSPTETSSAGQDPPGSSLVNERSWTCGVCGYVNPLQSTETRPGEGSKCGLCGIAYSISRHSVPSSRAGTPKPPSIPVLAPPIGTDDSASKSTPTTGSPTDATDGQTPAVDSGDTESTGGRIACPACTFLNHPRLPFCEICSTPLPRKGKPAGTVPSSPALANGVTSTGNGAGAGQTEVVRLSFRKGGVTEGYRRLKNVLSDKAWERKNIQTRRGHDRSSSTPINGVDGTQSSRAGAGIDGILQSISLDAKVQDEHMQDAFKDLEVLMVRAGEMVKLAQSLNTKLSASQVPIPEEDATLIRNSLVQLGLQAPALTHDMVRDEQRYFDGLAKELGGLLVGTTRGNGLMTGQSGRGVIGLDEVWGLWMRARGVALLPPSTLMSILAFLPSRTSPPIHLLTLPSSLKVLHTPQYSPPSILSRIHARLLPSPPTPTDGALPGSKTESAEEKSLSLIEIASHENLPIGLTKELMESIEALTPPLGTREVFGLVRDDQAVGDGGIRWYRDIISGWEL